MADIPIRINGRGVTLNYADMGDGTHAEVVYGGASAQATDRTMEISGRGITIKYRDMGNGTFAEVVYVGASAQATDRTMEIGGRNVRIKYRDMGDGTFAEVVYGQASAQATDHTMEISGRGITVKYRDMGDGTHARIVYFGTSAQDTDRTMRISGRALSVKYRDMGDATWSQVYSGEGSTGEFGLSDILAILNGATNALVTDVNDFSTLSQTRYYMTPVTAAGQAVGLALDLSQGLELGADLKGTAAVGLTGTATAATYNTGTGAGTCVRVDASNQSWVSIGSLNALYTYKAPITNTGAVELSIRTATSGGTVLATIAASATVDVYFNGNATCVVTASAAGTAAFTIGAFQHIAGNHFRAPNDGTERPTLVEITAGNYALQGDGTGDYMVSPNLDWTTIPGLTTVFGHNLTDNGSVAYVLNQNSNTAPNFRALSPAVAGQQNVQFTYQNSSGSNSRTPGVALDTPAVVGYRFSYDGTIGYPLDDGVIGASTATNPGGTGLNNLPLYLLARSTLANYSPQMMGRLVITPQALTDTQWLALSDWVNDRTGAY